MEIFKIIIKDYKCRRYIYKNLLYDRNTPYSYYVTKGKTYVLYGDKGAKYNYYISQ